MTTLVLLHSPLVGPLTLQPVAARLGAVAPDLRDAGGDLGAVAALLRTIPGSKILVGHSGAGRLLPGLADALGDVERIVYVDADPPDPGRTWWDSAPDELVTHLRSLSRDGFLPPWHEWFTPEDIAAVLPDPGMRAAFVGELRPVPLSFFDTPAPRATWAGPTGFLLLSEGYRAAADRARANGATVVEEIGHHLEMLTDPDRVAAALRRLIR